MVDTKKVQGEGSPENDALPDDVEPKADGADGGAYAANPELSAGEVIALRSADIHAESAKGNRHVKVFVIGPGPKPVPENGFSHEANIAAMRQYAISAGMRPISDGKLDSVEKHPDGVSWNLTYSVPVDVEDEIEHASEADIVTGGEAVEANTDGNGHSGDTRPKAAR